tara:strand:- start:20027 stop:20539 length:513 start_codon:yes stop_codon:yes gene_type:complete
MFPVHLLAIVRPAGVPLTGHVGIHSTLHAYQTMQIRATAHVKITYVILAALAAGLIRMAARHTELNVATVATLATAAIIAGSGASTPTRIAAVTSAPPASTTIKPTAPLAGCAPLAKSPTLDHPVARQPMRQLCGADTRRGCQRAVWARSHPPDMCTETDTATTWEKVKK